MKSGELCMISPFCLRVTHFPNKDRVSSLEENADTRIAVYQYMCIQQHVKHTRAHTLTYNVHRHFVHMYPDNANITKYMYEQEYRL